VFIHFCGDHFPDERPCPASQREKMLSIGRAKIAKEQEGLTVQQFLRKLQQQPRDANLSPLP